MRAHASWGSQQDVMLVFLNQDAYDRYRLSKEDFELLKEFEKEQKKAKEKDDEKTKDAKKSKAEKADKGNANKGKTDKSKADKEKSKVDSGKDSNQDESADDKADQKEILVELNGIEDRIVRLTPNSSDLGSAILSKDGEDLYYFSAFEDGYDLWKMNLREKDTKRLHKLNTGWASLMLDKKEIFFVGKPDYAKDGCQVGCFEVHQLSG